MTPRRWLVLLAGVVIAYAVFHMYTARSEFCGSCHDVMGEHYESWSSSSHGSLAECLDCHSEPGWTGYYHAKVEGARNALSYYFGVSKNKAEPPGRAACLRPGCHSDAELTGVENTGAAAHGGHLTRVGCVRCHGEVGHRARELAEAVDCAACHGGGSTEDVSERQEVSEGAAGREAGRAAETR